MFLLSLLLRFQQWRAACSANAQTASICCKSSHMTPLSQPESVNCNKLRDRRVWDDKRTGDEPRHCGISGPGVTAGGNSTKAKMLLQTHDASRSQQWVYVDMYFRVYFYRKTYPYLLDTCVYHSVRQQQLPTFITLNGGTAICLAV